MPAAKGWRWVGGIYESRQDWSFQQIRGALSEKIKIKAKKE